MSPDNIMRSDVLDIVFENRNKEYGAYALRKYYYKRLHFALSAVSVLTVLLAFMNAGKNKPVHSGGSPLSDTTTIELIIEPPPPEPELPKPQPEKIATIQYTVPKIVDEVKEDTMPPMEIVETAVISDHTTPGELPGERIITEQQVKEVIEKVSEKTEVSIPQILEYAEKMPAYPGGMEALKKYMMKNLMQPDDLEEGQKIIVVAKFIVREDGSIDEASIAKTGRSDLDREVLRVVRKMPHWEPGKQNGRQVSVWFQIPVTFVSEN